MLMFYTERIKMPDNVKIKIKSTITDLVLAEKYLSSAVNDAFRADDGKVYPIERLDELASDVIEYTAYGELFADGAGLVLRYRENPEIGYDNCTTSLVFSPSDRGSLVMVRDGDISTACRFDMKDKRQFCRYETPIIPVEFTVNTRSVHNTVDLDGGAILLDYKIEIHGVNTERNRLFIEVRPLTD